MTLSDTDEQAFHSGGASPEASEKRNSVHEALKTDRLVCKSLGCELEGWGHHSRTLWATVSSLVLQVPYTAPFLLSLG